eukprot:TRINITY_DN37831_c0_g1_i1.p1 TRINITY_DN37831_c0_g1~~TRINITY_DN37831_c0_g1_i1.p1  ORF type:complete len:230 (+),score=35.89 TRINITY_DN37831_c0_g1_i1:82-771(+)
MHVHLHHHHHARLALFEVGTLEGLMWTCLINGVTYVISDQLAQKVEAKWDVEKGLEPKKCDIIRTMRFGTVGMIWGGTTTFGRFKFISLVFPGAGLKTAAGKVLINQFVFSPIAHGGILLFNEWGKTGSFKKGWDKLCYNLLEVQLVTWATKVPLNLICFSLISSIPLQALFMRTYDIFFYIYISYVAERSDIPEKQITNPDEEDEDEKHWAEEPPIRKSDRTCNCAVM